MKKLVLGLSFLIIYVFGCLDAYASTPNTSDTTYTFSNTSEPSSTQYRDKHTSTKVYVYPQYGPKIYYTVRGCLKIVYPDGNWETSVPSNRSQKVAIPTGTRGSITNTVYESGENYACLRLERINYGYVTTGGYWSPDSTRNYTVY